MAESIQHVLDRVRPPRVQITYDVEIGNAIQKKELPFVVGILADLIGKSTHPLPLLKERKFVEIDRDNFNEVLKSLHPALFLRVPGLLDPQVASLNVELHFEEIDDFNPGRVIRQIPVLDALYQSRVRLTDLTSKLDGNDDLDHELSSIFASPDLLSILHKEIESDETPEIKRIIETGKVIRDPSQMSYAISMLKELLLHIPKDIDKNESNVYSGDVYAFIEKLVQTTDTKISLQLDAVLHHPDFQKLEASWLGLRYLVMNTETSTSLKLRLLQISWKEMVNDLEKAVEFDQSQLFKKIYEDEYGTFGGNPYSCLLGDFEFGRHPQHVDTLRRLSNIAAAAHAPLISAAHPNLFDMDTFSELGNPRDLSKIFESTETIKWNSFRNSEDSRYVTLLLPHMLMRQPYGAKSVPVEEFRYEEGVSGINNRLFCWGNPAYAMAQRITYSFALYGWTAAIRGVEGGGLVEGLPVYSFKTSGGDTVLKCPTEITITDRREKELSDLGLIGLCHCKGQDFAAFFGGQTTQKPKLYNLDQANANARISARLPYVLISSRFAHYIKVMMRDKLCSFMSQQELSGFLNNWITNYVLDSDMGSQASKARLPLREARIDVVEVPGKPGSYKAIVFLRPHFQLEELTVSLRLVAQLPAPSA